VRLSTDIVTAQSSTELEGSTCWWIPFKFLGIYMVPQGKPTDIHICIAVGLFGTCLMVWLVYGILVPLMMPGPRMPPSTPQSSSQPHSHDINNIHTSTQHTETSRQRQMRRRLRRSETGLSHPSQAQPIPPAQPSHPPTSTHTDQSAADVRRSSAIYQHALRSSIAGNVERSDMGGVALYSLNLDAAPTTSHHAVSQPAPHQLAPRPPTQSTSSAFHSAVTPIALPSFVLSDSSFRTSPSSSSSSSSLFESFPLWLVLLASLGALLLIGSIIYRLVHGSWPRPRFHFGGGGGGRNWRCWPHMDDEEGGKMDARIADYSMQQPLKASLLARQGSLTGAEDVGLDGTPLTGSRRGSVLASQIPPPLLSSVDAYSYGRYGGFGDTLSGHGMGFLSPPPSRTSSTNLVETSDPSHQTVFVVPTGAPCRSDSASPYSPMHPHPYAGVSYQTSSASASMMDGEESTVSCGTSTAATSGSAGATSTAAATRTRSRSRGGHTLSLQAALQNRDDMRTPQQPTRTIQGGTPGPSPSSRASTSTASHVGTIGAGSHAHGTGQSTFAFPEATVDPLSLPRRKKTRELMMPMPPPTLVGGASAAAAGYGATQGHY